MKPQCFKGLCKGTSQSPRGRGFMKPQCFKRLCEAPGDFAKPVRNGAL